MIEFIHTEKSVPDIVDSIRSVGRPLHVATQETAIRDLKRVGRNVHLIID
ncbi:TPA: hypothetical protein ACX6MG_002798 [Photobacterium damselae]